MLLKESLEGKKYYEDVVRLVDTIIENKEFPKEKLNGKPSQIKILPNKSIFKSDNYAVERVLSIFVSSLFIIAIFGCVYIVSPVDSSRSEINVYLTPSNVHENDTMFVNVTVPSSFGIQSATADISGIESLDLSLVDNSSGIELWQTVWVVPVVEVGNHIATVTLVDTNNNSFVSEASWSVFSDDAVVDSNYSEIPTNETSDEPINQTDNNSVPPTNETVDESNNQTNIDENYTEIPTNETSEPSANETVLDYTLISAAQAKEMIDLDSTVLVLDVRSSKDYDSGHINGSISIPMSNMTYGSYINDTLGIYKKSSIIVYGNDNSDGSLACKLLLNNSYARIFLLDGGIKSWMAAGFPVTSALNENLSDLESNVTQSTENNFWESVDKPQTAGMISNFKINYQKAWAYMLNRTSWVLQARTSGVWNDVSGLSIAYNDVAEGKKKFGLVFNATAAPVSDYRLVLNIDLPVTDFDKEDANIILRSAAFDRGFTFNFDYSDIAAIPGLIFDYGFENGGFRFIVEKDNVPFGTFVDLDPTYGLIQDAVTSSLEWNTAEGRKPDMIRLWNETTGQADSEYYLVAAAGDTGTTYDGWLYTLHVYNNNGTIQQTVVDSWEYDSRDAYYPSICHVAHDVYAIAYNITGQAYVNTTKVWGNNGSMQKTTIDSYGFQYGTGASIAANGKYTNIINVAQNLFCVAWQEQSNNTGFIQTISIDETGQIGATKLDSAQFNTTYGSYPKQKLLHTSSTGLANAYIAIVYTGSNDDGYLVTYAISTSTGKIGGSTHAVADEWEFDQQQGVTPNIYYVSGNVYAIAYQDAEGDGRINTTSITTAGVITKSWTDSLEFDIGDCMYPTIFHVSGIIYGITYIQPIVAGTGTGVVRTINITDSGTITPDTAGQYTDSLNFEALSDSWYSPISYVNKSYYLIVDHGQNDDGWSYTVEIITNYATPTAEKPSPDNGSTGQSTEPLLSIEISDLNADTMTVRWESNSSGTWQQFASNTSCTNGSYEQRNRNFSQGNTTYYWRVVVDDGLNTANETYHFTTASGTIIYYFNAYEVGKNWTTSPANMIDNDPMTYASTTTNTQEQNQNGNTYSGTNWGTILSVEIRDYGYRAIAGGSATVKLVPYFTAGAGSTYAETSGTPAWSSWFNITSDTNAPSPWTWSDVTNLDCLVTANIPGGNTLYCGIVEIRVNYTNVAPEQIGEAPTNQATGICIPVRLYVTCQDADFQTMTATWRSNSSGTWTTFATNTSITYGMNITQNFTNATTLGTTYWWSVNLTDGYTWTNNTYRLTTNYAPTQTNPGPADQSIGVNATPPLNVTCSDSDSNTMTAQWWSNSSGTWAIFATNTSISTGTNIIQTNSNFSNYSVTYYWSVNLTDGCNWTNTTRSFRTMSISTSVDTITPYNISTNPLQINATGPSTLSNVTLWYRWNSVNNSWDGTAGSNNTYYFTSRTSGWENNPDYMNDSDDTTYATTKTDAQTELVMTPNSTGSGTITYVYLRCRAYNRVGLGGDITLQPEFTGGHGDPHTITLTSSATWYTVDITNDTSAPSPWTWSDFDNLQCRVISAFPGGGQVYCSMVQIIVEGLDSGTTVDWMQWTNNSNPDTSSPWSWNFNFTNGTGYYQFYSIGKKTGSTDETAPTTNDTGCQYVTGSCSVTPTTWNMGHVWIGDTNATTNTTFTVTNDGGVPIFVQIKADNATNGTDKWQLNSTADYDNFTLQYQKNGVSTWTNVNLTYDTFITTLTVGDNNQFGLKMIMATSSSTVNEMSFTVTLLAVAL